uniref:G-protein coupled receptors family 1 profile domain-containing protein n=1 Tax=Echeneis naucrates TaxID=173247 RepID=A0A665W7Q3_ECHNA
MLLGQTIFLLAVAGNLLVGWVIGSSRQSLTPSDVYLFHLTIADGLMALTLPFFAVSLVQGWVFGDFMCKAISLMFEANVYSSIIFLACISMDRYIAIVHSSDTIGSHHRRCSWLLSAAVWAFGGTLSLPALFTEVILDSGRMLCMTSFDLGNATSWRLATRIFRHLFGFFIPLAVMVICYGVTVGRLLRTRGFQKHRAMKVIIAVVIAFVLCWMPYHVSQIADTVLRTDLLPFDCAARTRVSTAMSASSAVALLHSCINPVLYAFVGERFRSKMMLLCRRKLRQERLSRSKFSRSTSQTSEGKGAIL